MTQERMTQSPPRYAPMTIQDQRAARKRIMMRTKEGYDEQIAESKNLSSSDAFVSRKDSYTNLRGPNDMAILSYNNRENDKGWKEVIDHERSLKKDNQQRYR